MEASTNTEMLRPVSDPFVADGGMRLVTGNLGRAIFKTSAVAPERWTIEAPAAIFHDQDDVLRAFKAGELDRDVVVVVRFQGPRANGMPELHKLTPALGVLQDRGFKVALVTDGRMSGASGKVPAAIHCSPEALGGGPLALLRDGDVVQLCAENASLEAVGVDLSTREPAPAPPPPVGTGRELFAMMRQRRRQCRAWRVGDARGDGNRAVNIDHIMRIAPVIPVLVLDGTVGPVALAETLVAAGLPVIEVTLRTSSALDAIRAMSAVEGAIVGAGTVLDPQQLGEALDAGAQFIVSPGLTERLSRAAIDSGVAYLPGIANAGDIMRGLDLGLTDFKFFPAEASGGLAALKALAAPFAQVRFCPTGGIRADTAAEWLAHPSVLCVGGSWLVPPGETDLAAVATRARAAAAAQVSGFPRVSLRKTKATTTLIAVKTTGYQSPA